jgi:pyrroline-5-carboxylate reductase
MKRYGFIGYGNMGRAVLLSLLGNGYIAPDKVMVYNRTPDRLKELSASYPDVVIASDPSEIARASDVLFLCTDSSAVLGVLEDLSPYIDMRTHVVSINGGISIEEIEARHNGPVSRVIPTMIMTSGHGLTLITHGSRVPLAMQMDLQALFQRCSKVKVLAEDDLVRYTDLTSCAPGLLAMMVEAFVQAGARSSGLPLKEVQEVLLETLVGTASILAKGSESTHGLMEKVATKGGITEKGLRVLEMELPSTFDHMFEATRKAR